MSRAQEVANFILERESIRRKDQGPHDPILTQYRFCNVRREDDRVTRWLKKNWRDPYAGHPNMVGAMLLARMVNWPPTLEGIGFPEKWAPEDYEYRILNQKGKTWSGAYIVSTCGKKMDKATYVVQTVGQVVGNAWHSPQAGDTLQAVWTRLKTIDGLGAGFIAAQVVADLKYVVGSPLIGCADWWTWACSGPGSRRGLNRYVEAPVNESWKEQNWLETLHQMIDEVSPLLPPDWGKIHAQDYQNVMCEWDKYERTRLGEGKPRSRYSPETAYQV